MTPLKMIGSNLWIAEGPIVGFYSFPYPTRTVSAGLSDGAVWLWSPIATAIFVDLMGNFSLEFLRDTPGWRGWRTTIARLWKITEPVGRTPLEWRLSFLRRSPGRNALERILGWDPENVVMAHGVIRRSDAKEFIRASFSWL